MHVRNVSNYLSVTETYIHLQQDFLSACHVRLQVLHQDIGRAYGQHWARNIKFNTETEHHCQGAFKTQTHNCQ